MFSFVIPVYNKERFDENVGRSKIYKERNGKYEFQIVEGYTNVRKAMNDGIKCCFPENKIILCHEDVFFPDSFEEDLILTIEQMEEIDPEWDVLGTAGIFDKKDQGKEYIMSCIDRGSRYGTWVPDLGHPIIVDTLDEHFLILQNSDFRFDEEAPNRHFYGAEICRALQGNCYVIPAVVHHNGQHYNNPLSTIKLNKEMFECKEYFKKHHPDWFPLKTTCGDYE